MLCEQMHLKKNNEKQEKWVDSPHKTPSMQPKNNIKM